MGCKQGIIASFAVTLAINTIFCNAAFTDDNNPQINIYSDFVYKWF